MVRPGLGRRLLGRPVPRRLRAPAAALFALAAVAAAPAPLAAAAAAPETPPWQAAERLRTDLSAAQSALLTGGPARAARAVARARAHYRGELRAGVLAAGPDADAAARGALSDAARAARAGDARALAAARGASRAALLRGAYAAALAAAGRTDPAAARAWLRLRDVRTTTRPGADATQAVAALEAGRLSPRATRAAIARDVLDASQARLRELLDDAAAGIARGLTVRVAEAAGQAEGSFALLRLRYLQDRGEPVTGRAAARFAALRRAATAGRATRGQVAAAAAALDGFTAAPPTRQAVRRAQPPDDDRIARALDPMEAAVGVGAGLGLALTLALAVATFRSGALAQELRVKRPRRRAAAQPSRGSRASSPPQGSEPDSREPATSQTEPASVIAASAPPARGR